MSVLDESRERKKLTEVAAMAPEGMKDYTRLLFERLLELSRAYQGSLM